MRGDFYNLNVPTSVAAGTSFPADQLADKWVQIAGTFVATLDIEGSLNGTDWFKISTGNTAPACVQIAPTVKSLRVNVTAYTSGTPKAILGGNSERGGG